LKILGIIKAQTNIKYIISIKCKELISKFIFLWFMLLFYFNDIQIVVQIGCSHLICQNYHYEKMWYYGFSVKNVKVFMVWILKIDYTEKPKSRISVLGFSVK
jgi:hypothetical protein